MKIYKIRYEIDLPDQGCAEIREELVVSTGKLDDLHKVLEQYVPKWGDFLLLGVEFVGELK